MAKDSIRGRERSTDVSVTEGPFRGWRINGTVSRAEAVAGYSDLPAEADVVVIGAGIAGISTALFLNEKGLKTVVLEKGVVAGEQSSRAFGWVYSNGWHHEKLELANRSKEIWRSFSGRFGEDTGYRQSGNFALLKSEEEVEQSRRWLDRALAVQPHMDAKIVAGSDLEHLVPGASTIYTAALYQASDGTAEPSYSVSRIAVGAMREGVQIVAPCAARTIEREAGKVAGVHSERGYIKAPIVVLAGGAWASLFAQNCGVRFPQLGLVGSHLRLNGASGAVSGAGHGTDGISWRQHANGETSIGAQRNPAPITKESFRYFFDFLPTLSHGRGLFEISLGRDFLHSLLQKSTWGAHEVTPFEETRMLAARPQQASNALSLTLLKQKFPQYEGAMILEEWAGIIDATPDSTPFVTAVPNFPGLFLIAGFSGGGFTTGPAAGEMIAELIAAGKTTCNPSIYRFDRFTDGSRFEFRH